MIALETIKRLVQKYGREIRLVQLDANGADQAVVKAYGVPVTLSEGNSLGLRADQLDLTKDVSVFYIVEPISGSEFTEFHQVRDGAVEFRIEFIQRLRPLTETLLYYLGASR